MFGDGKPVINGLQFATVIVKQRGDARPESFAPALRAAINRVDPNLPLYFFATPKTNQEGFLAQNRIVADMFAIFGAIAEEITAGNPVYGFRFHGQRFDCGSKAGFLQATVAYGLARADLHDEFEQYLNETVAMLKAAQ